jgi:hypothetical protein
MLREDDRTTVVVVVVVEWITIRYDCWRFDWEGTGNLTGELTGVDWHATVVVWISSQAEI